MRSDLLGAVLNLFKLFYKNVFINNICYRAFKQIIYDTSLENIVNKINILHL